MSFESGSSHDGITKISREATTSKICNYTAARVIKLMKYDVARYDRDALFAED